MGNQLLSVCISDRNSEHEHDYIIKFGGMSNKARKKGKATIYFARQDMYRQNNTKNLKRRLKKAKRNIKELEKIIHSNHQ